MTSGNKTPVTDRGYNGHSVFAYQFIRILEKNHKPYLTPREIYMSIGPVIRNNSEQMPMCRPIQMTGDMGGEFIFIRENVSASTADKDRFKTTKYEKSTASSTISHKIPDFLVPDCRFIVRAKIVDPSGINIARCYFRTGRKSEMLFINLKHTAGNVYEGIIPAPAGIFDSLTYQFLAVTNNHKTWKSRLYKVPIVKNEKIPPWQTASKEGAIESFIE
jgi:hypothetical protein